MRRNYTYDAFGKLEGRAGYTENNYQFTGEQFDRNLGEYYLRQRYYSSSNGLFIGRDSWKGRLTEPVTLHKYIYANDNPANWIDLSGNSARRFGQLIHEKIGEDFERLDPANHLSDNKIEQILRRRLGNYPGGGFGDSRRPDLADIGTQEVYEIKPFNRRQIIAGYAQLLLYWALLNAHDPGWTVGSSYVPPGIVILPEDPHSVYYVVPPVEGLILYTRINTRELSNTLVAITIAAVSAAIIAELITAIGAKGGTGTLSPVT